MLFCDCVAQRMWSTHSKTLIGKTWIFRFPYPYAQVKLEEQTTDVQFGWARSGGMATNYTYALMTPRMTQKIIPREWLPAEYQTDTPRCTLTITVFVRCVIWLNWGRQHEGLDMKCTQANPTTLQYNSKFFCPPLPLPMRAFIFWSCLPEWED